jgi:hypothetical protein
MKWYRLTSRDGELVTVERMMVPVERHVVNYGGVECTVDQCRTFEDAHVCLVEAESIDSACAMRCTKSCMI